MPKIPTYTAKGRITAETPGVTSNIKVSPYQTAAGAISPLARAAEDYYIKKRNAAEKIESEKIANEIRGDMDISVYQNKDNINEDESINRFKESFENSKSKSLLKIKNNRVKERVNNILNLEYSEYVNKIKKNSYIALEKETIEQSNNKLTNIISKYSTDESEITKQKHIDQGLKEIDSLSETFLLPKNKKEDLIKKFKKNLLSGDMTKIFTNSRNIENIKSIDDSLGGEKTTSDQEFTSLSFNAIKNRVEQITVIGDENSNFDEAKDLIEKYEDLERSNGFKPSSVIKKEIADLKQKINLEEVRHENVLRKTGENKLYYDFSKDAKNGLLKSITDKGSGIPTTLEDQNIANEIEAEFEQMSTDYLDANPDATLEEKKSFIRNLSVTLSNIYKDRKFSKIKSRSFTEDTFDIIAEKNRVVKDAKLLSQGELDVNTRLRYEKIAKAQGYVTKITENGKQKTVGDIGAFLNDYLPILKKQVTATQIME